MSRESLLNFITAITEQILGIIACVVCMLVSLILWSFVILVIALFMDIDVSVISFGSWGGLAILVIVTIATGSRVMFACLKINSYIGRIIFQNKCYAEHPTCKIYINLKRNMECYRHILAVSVDSHRWPYIEFIYMTPVEIPLIPGVHKLHFKFAENEFDYIVNLIEGEEIHLTYFSPPFLSFLTSKPDRKKYNNLIIERSNNHHNEK